MPKKLVARNFVVNALAGCGKTFTGIEGINRMLKRPTAGVVGSDQQEKIWQHMAGIKARRVAVMAFNKPIAEELKEKVPMGVLAGTFHSFGFGALRRSSRNRLKVNSWRTANIISEVTGKDWRELRKHDNEKVEAVRSLVSLCKQTLTEPTPEALDALCSHYDILTNGDSVAIFELTAKVVEASKEVVKEIDFDDMLWLPLVHNLPLDQQDFLLVDEAQDLNRARQELALRMTVDGVLGIIGDVNQAIYGFAGADVDSIPTMIDAMGNRGGCCQFKLTQTRRCGKAIVEHAAQLVPDFTAHESCPDGLISEVSFDQFIEDSKAGDMGLCRVNAPVVGSCFKLLRAGKKANIQGRDVGEGLARLIKKMKAVSVGDLIEKIDDWYHDECQKESKKRNPSDDKLIMLEDKKACIDVFTEGAIEVADVLCNIDSMFTDKAGKDTILLSSIHKSKGLEADRVFILEPHLIPHPMAKQDWAKGQERNLDYVARTRAINELTYIAG